MVRHFRGQVKNTILYYMSEHKTVIDYSDSFQADMSECVGLGIISFDDVAKRKLLCDNLLGLEELGNTLDDCEEKNMTYDESMKHIREKVYRYKRVQHRKKKGQSSVLLKTETNLQDNDNVAPPNSPQITMILDLLLRITTRK